MDSMRASLALILISFFLPYSLKAAGNTTEVDPLIVRQLNSDLEQLFANMAPQATKEQKKTAEDTLVFQVIHDDGEALLFKPDEIQSLEKGHALFTVAQTKAAYAGLKETARSRPMPVLVEFYKKIYDAGKMQPTQQAIFVKLMLVITKATKGEVQ